MSEEAEKHFIIGVPTFNRSHLIPRVIHSIQEQKHSNWTILFVDDGSTDGTKDIITALAEDNVKIQYRPMIKNSGVNAARNYIVQQAKLIDSNAYLLLIDDDDYLAQNALCIANKQISLHPEFNWYSLNCHYENGDKISKITEYGALSYISDYMFGKKIRGDLTHILKIEALANEVFTTEFKNGEEWYFWVKISENHEMYAIDAPGSIKEYLEGGLTETGINRDKIIQVLKYKIKILTPMVGHKAMAHQYVSLAKNHIAKGNFEEASEILTLVFQHSPLYLRQYRHWVHLFFKKNISV